MEKDVLKKKKAIEGCEITTEERALIARVAKPLLLWYDGAKRDLPWRSQITPYRVWLSEIMLQQTRVEAGKDYFLRFIRELPDVEALANVSEQKLMKLWEGLGYYNRARNLKKAAGVVMEKYGGELPSSYEELLSLPGIGPYTAGAISSIAFGKHQPAVDGNVLRVIMRLLGRYDDVARDCVKKAVQEALKATMEAMESKESFHPGDFNQALMELGATICIPNGRPRCEDCPWMADCAAKKRGIALELPVKQSKKKRRIEERTVLILWDEKERLLLHRREEKGLLAGLWELPSLPGKMSEDEVRKRLKRLDGKLRLSELHPAGEAVHVFSHVEWHMTGYEGRISCSQKAEDRIAEEERPYLKDVKKEEPDWILAEKCQIQKELALPSAFKGFRFYYSSGLSEGF